MIPAVNLAPDPVNEVVIAFEVPADFMEGTLSIGGTSSQPGGWTADFGANVYQTAISIPAGWRGRGSGMTWSRRDGAPAMPGPRDA